MTSRHHSNNNRPEIARIGLQFEISEATSNFCEKPRIDCSYDFEFFDISYDRCDGHVTILSDAIPSVS